MAGAAGLGEALRARGLRQTPQRRLVLQAVAELGHATAEEVAGRVQRQAPDVNLSTVYRALDVLVGVGLLGRSHLAAGAASYHLLAHADHIHLLCTGCGALAEVPSAEGACLAERIAEVAGFAVDVRHLVLRGTCAACRDPGPPGGV